MKTLYISDLDGTLLDADVKVSEFTVKAINSLIKKGMYFTVATARTIATVTSIMEKVNLNVPIVLMNGVSVYDSVNKVYLKTYIMEKDSMQKLFTLLKKLNLSGFVYTIKNNVLNTYFENLDTEHRRNFYEERTRKYGKVINKVEDFNDTLNEDIIYFSTCDKEENLRELYNELLKDTKLNIEFYRDIYLKDYWYLEISSHNASKYNAVNFLKEKFKFDRVVSFGDNFNDIPMFKASNESYAMQNAREKVKQEATAVIDFNTNNGVAKWLLENYKGE
ncbi:MAG: HAD family hydrolase [Clostridia bacterium]